jgi:DnaJ-class molecular chaperone
MSEIGEAFEGYRAARQAKRAENRQRSKRMLVNAGITFEEKNDGAHLIVRCKDERVYDFWPGTGLWRARHNERQGRGVFRLLNEIQL